MNSQDSQALLPSGFMDVLPPDAEAESRAIQSLMSLFFRFGYERVKPPLVEFEESLLSDGPGAALAGDTFRMMDPESRQMLALRSDSTPQISRIARSRLAGEQRPLRLTYATDVLRTRASQDRMARQFTQAGCEIIGCTQAYEQVELAVLSVWGLHRLGVKDITLDLALPRLVDHLLRAYKVYKEEERAAIIEALRRRDRDFFSSRREKIYKVLADLLSLDDGPEDTMKKLGSLGDKDIRILCRDLKDVYLGIGQALEALGIEDIKLRLDIFEHKGFEYHDGVAYTIFAAGVRGELGRGGLYSLSGAEDVPQMAAGFTLYMDTIRGGYTPAIDKKIVLVDPSVDWAELKDLQAEGWRIWRGDKRAAPPDCKHEFKNGTVKEI